MDYMVVTRDTAPMVGEAFVLDGTDVVAQTVEHCGFGNYRVYVMTPDELAKFGPFLLLSEEPLEKGYCGNCGNSISRYSSVEMWRDADMVSSCPDGNYHRKNRNSDFCED